MTEQINCQEKQLSPEDCASRTLRSASDCLSLHIPRTRLPAACSLAFFCLDLPIPPRLTETLSGLLQI